MLSSDYALWWSPDSSKLAFLRLDETLVDFYNFPIYNPTGDAKAVFPYTTDIRMKYPKPGYANPLVSVHVFDLGWYQQRRGEDVSVEDAMHTLQWEGRQYVNNSIVTEIAWVGDAQLLLKEVNRAADDGSVVLFDLSNIGGGRSVDGKVVRKLGKNGEQGDEGWIESVSLPSPSFRVTHTQERILIILFSRSVAIRSPASTNHSQDFGYNIRIPGHREQFTWIQSYCVVRSCGRQ